MIIKNISENVTSLITSTVKNVNHSLVTNAPAIGVGVGILAGIATVAFAIEATPKAMEIIKHAKELEESIKETSTDEYTEQEIKTAVLIARLRAAKSVFLVYWKSILTGVLSIAAVLYSYKVLNGRYLGMVSAYKTLDKLYMEYKKTVEEVHGSESEKAVADKTVEKLSARNKEEEQQIKKYKHYSGYAQIFDESSKYWENDANWNRMFIHKCLAMANQKLDENGKVFLYEVYELLGFETSKDDKDFSKVVGWIKDKNHPDTQISFGIYENHSENMQAFRNGTNKYPVLDFNVQGPVLFKARW